MKLHRILAALGAAIIMGLAAPAWAQRQSFDRATLPQRYEIEVTPNAEEGTLTGRVRIHFETAAPTNRITINAAEMTFSSVRLDGRAAQAVLDAAAQTATITASRTLRPGRHTLDIAYAGRIYDEAYGLFRVSYEQDGAQRRLLATQFEPGDARRFAPMFDQPDMRAVFDLTAIVPEGDVALSNMPIAETAALPGGMKRVRFQSSPSMPSYLLFLAVGDLERISTRTPDGVEVGVVTVRGQSESGRYALQAAVETLGYFTNYFGVPYPLPKLDNLGVPGAGGFGAMENWGAILYFDQYLLLDPALSSEYDRQSVFGIVAHEVAHQWFGNLVTMAWWDDLWLNEGFASWMADKATEALHPDWAPWLAAAGGRNQAMDIDARAGTHPIVQTVNSIDQANLAFDTITYQKGQAVIRTIETYIGEEAFRNGVRAYISSHLYGSARTDELWQALEAASNTPITRIARDFTTQNGVPLVSVQSEPCAPGATTTRLRLTQARFAADEASRTGEAWTIPIVARRVGAAESVRLLLAPEGGVLEAPGGCGAVKVNAGENAYFRTLYAPADLDALVASFAALSADDQLGLLADYWAFGKSGAASMRDYLRLVNATPNDANPYVVMQAAGALRRLAEYQQGRPGEAAFNAYARAHLAPHFARVGWDARAGEAVTDAVLRDVLISILGWLNDPAIVAEARRRVEAADPSALPGGIREAALRVVGSQADARWHQWLVDQARNAATSLERDQYLSALAEVQDPALAQRTLDLALTDAFPRTLRPVVIRRVGTTHPDLTWAFIAARRAEVDALLDPLQRLEFAPQIVSRSGEAARIAELNAFAQAYPTDARQPVVTAEAAIAGNARVRTERLGDVDAFVAAATAPPPPEPRRRPRRPAS
jgi:aminopeptidase N